MKVLPRWSSRHVALSTSGPGEHVDEIEQLRKDREDAFDDFLDRFEEKLNGEYREMLKEDIVDELDRE